MTFFKINETVSLGECGPLH